MTKIRCVWFRYHVFKSEINLNIFCYITKPYLLSFYIFFIFNFISFLEFVSSLLFALKRINFLGERKKFLIAINEHRAVGLALFTSFVITDNIMVQCATTIHLYVFLRYTSSCETDAALLVVARCWLNEEKKIHCEARVK